jgi:hypothetical protein
VNFVTTPCVAIYLQIRQLQVAVFCRGHGKLHFLLQAGRNGFHTCKVAGTMKLAHVVVASTLSVAAYGYAPAVQHNFGRAATPMRPTTAGGVVGFLAATRATSTTTARFMVESDFASAMPTKPELSLSERLEQRAREFVDTIRSSLGDGVAEPPELIALESAYTNGANPETLAIRIYELMIEQGMLYDKDPETGILTPTGYDIPSNLDVPEVQKEFKYLYTYGMSLIAGGIISIETVKDIVKDRLIARTGLEPEEFDAWLGF